MFYYEKVKDEKVQMDSQIKQFGQDLMDIGGQFQNWSIFPNCSVRHSSSTYMLAKVNEGFSKGRIR